MLDSVEKTRVRQCVGDGHGLKDAAGAVTARLQATDGTQDEDTEATPHIDVEGAAEDWVSSRVEEIKALWSGLPAGLEAKEGYSTLQELLHLKTINRFRRNELARCMSWWSLCVLVLTWILSAVYAAALLSTGGVEGAVLTEISLVVSVGLFAGTLVVIGFEAGTNTTRGRLRYHIQRYLTQAEEQISEIRTTAADTITAEGKRARSEGVPLDAVTNDLDTRRRVKAAIRSLVADSIALDRFPRALKEAWEGEIDAAMADWHYAAEERKRVLPVLLDTLMLLIVIAFAAAVALVSISANDQGLAANVGVYEMATPSVVSPGAERYEMVSGENETIHSAAGMNVDRILLFGACLVATIMIFASFLKVAVERVIEKTRTPLPILLLVVPSGLILTAFLFIFMNTEKGSIYFSISYLSSISILYAASLRFSNRAKNIYRELAVSLMIKIGTTLRVHRKEELLAKYKASGLVTDGEDLLQKLAYSFEGGNSATARVQEWRAWLALPEEERNVGEQAFVGLRSNLKLIVAEDRPANKIADHFPASPNATG